MPDKKDLELLILGHTPILQIESHEEKRALDLLVRIAVANRLPVYQWSVTEGLKRLDIDLGTQRHNAEPADVLGHIKSSSVERIFVLLDFDPYLSEPTNTRFIKEIAMKFDGSRNKLVFISHKIEMPMNLNHSVVRFDLSLPNEEALIKIIREEARKWQHESGQKVSLDKQSVLRIVSNLKGLTFKDARRLIRNAIVNDGAITESDADEIMQAKYRLLNRDDVISFEYDTACFGDVGGMSRLKQWLHQREKVFHAQERLDEVDGPRGLLLLGVQGCGKSLAAKAVAGIWKVPLLRFDFAALYDKYIGESEKNLRASLNTAGLMAPCVLWIDEIEKGISGGNDDGTSRRILGALLTWLAENKARVFVVATANNIDALPPELIRKGRLDEIFFVDPPKEDIRKQIFYIHLEKRKVAIDEINMDEVARASDGFSGAEIEQVIVSALYAVRAGDAEMNTRYLLDEIAATRPLSVVMDEKITQLRQWAAHRTVPVD
ncbi:MAG: AAA family ATPase [Gammaproteobacteria bacterium]|nr:AAA family ATPase [Gammaproteobacteria bacterium]